MTNQQKVSIEQLLEILQKSESRASPAACVKLSGFVEVNSLRSTEIFINGWFDIDMLLDELSRIL